MRYEPPIGGDDENQFAARLREALPVARRVATMVLGTDQGADDVVQAAMERAWRARRRYDPARPFAPWFLRIVANAARNDRRQRGRHAALRRRAAAQVAAHQTTPEEVLAGDADLVVAALNRLDAEDRAVLALRFVEQFSEAEVATVLDCPVGTVKSRASRAKARLRVELARLEEPT